MFKICHPITSHTWTIVIASLGYTCYHNHLTITPLLQRVLKYSYTLISGWAGQIPRHFVQDHHFFSFTLSCILHRMSLGSKNEQWNVNTAQ